MATTLTDNLKLRLSEDLTADAKYNLERIDLLAGNLSVNTLEELVLRASEDIIIEPQSADIGGSGSGGIVNVGTASHNDITLDVHGDVEVERNLILRTDARFYDDDETNYIALQAATDVTADVTFTLPPTDGTVDQVLKTDGAGNWDWTTVGTTSLNRYNVRIGNVSNTATPTDTNSTGDILADSTGGLTYKPLSIDDADISNSASIARSKLAVDTVDAVVINNSGGVQTSEAQLAITRGGTAAANASDARDNLGLTIGVNVQAQNTDLQAVADLTPTDNDIMIRTGGVWTVTNPPSYYATLGLGTIATQDSDSVALTGGAIDDTTIGATTPSTVDATTVTASTSVTTDTIDVSAAGNMVIGATVGANNVTLGAATSTVIIPGNMQVDGTTTSVNSATLDVTDANITVNVSGNQAAADDTAGLTVEMSDAVNASLIYDKDATSRFRIGDVGSEVEIADISSVQTLTGKNILGSRNAQADWITSDGTTKIVTHSFATVNVMVQLFEIDTGETIEVDTVTRNDTNNITLTASEAPTGSGWRVLIQEVN